MTVAVTAFLGVIATIFFRTASINPLPSATPTPIIIVNTVPRAIKLVKLLIIEVYIYLILSADKRLTAIVSFVIKVLVAVS